VACRPRPRCGPQARSGPARVEQPRLLDEPGLLAWVQAGPRRYRSVTGVVPEYNVESAARGLQSAPGRGQRHARGSRLPGRADLPRRERVDARVCRRPAWA